MKPSDKWIHDHYEVIEYKSALTLLMNHYPEEWREIKFALRAFRLYRSEIIVGGKNKTLITKRLEKPLLEKKKWKEVKARTHTITEVGTGLNTKKERIIYSKQKTGNTHKIDLFKNTVGIEIEWNSKDGVFSRDLDVFRTLHNMDVLNIGVIITRKSDLQSLFTSLGVGNKYGSSTTHMRKLLERIDSTVIGCPLVIFGISDRLYDATK